MDKNMVALDVVKEALRVNYEFRVKYSQKQKKFNSCLEQRTIHGTVFRSIEIEFSEYLVSLSNMARMLKQDNMSLLVTFNKELDKYQAVILEKVVKGPYLEDEYLVPLTQYQVFESSPKNALEVMEIMLADELAINATLVKKRSGEKKRIVRNHII